MSDKSSAFRHPQRFAGFSQERWRERFLSLILRGACVLGLAAAAVGIADCTRQGQFVLAGIYAASWAVLAVVTAIRRPYWLRAGVFLFLLFTLGASGLLENGMRGDARLFFLVLAVMAALLVEPWAGIATLAFCLLLIGAFAPFAISGRIQLLSKVTTAGDAQLWITSGLGLLLLGGAILIGLTHLLRQFTDAQKHLIESATKFSKVFNANPLAMSIASLRDDRIIEVNEAFQKRSGYSRDEMIGRTIPDLGFFIDPARLHELHRLFDADGSIRNLEIQLRVKAGGHLTCLLSVEPIELAGERCYIFATTDISDRKRLEEQLRQSQKMDSLGRLAGGIAHDFNNILSVILGNIGLLREQELSPEPRAQIQEIESATNRAVSMTRQLLLFGKGQVIVARPIDLNEVVNAMTRMLRRLIGEDIDLVFRGEPTSLRIKADAGMIDQVLMNLCLNARDAMPSGGQLIISTRRENIGTDFPGGNPEARAGAFVCLSVTDTGSGMDGETLRHMFEPFFSTKKAGQGTGLGLANVYGIVKQHDGWIHVTSEVGRGTRFNVYLPAYSEVESFQESVEPGAERRGTEGILLVEDDHGLRKTAATWLRKLGYRVSEASNGVEALATWAKCRDETDLLVTDMVMPGGISGFQLAEQLQAGKPSLRIIVNSGYTPEAFRADYLDERGFFYLPKPYGAAELAAAVRKCIERPGAGGGPNQQAEQRDG